LILQVSQLQTQQLMDDVTFLIRFNDDYW